MMLRSNMKSIIIKKAVCLLGLMLVAPSLVFAAKTTLDTVEVEQTKNINDAQKSQKNVDKIYDETQDLKARYRQALQSIENVKIYNDQLREVIESQKLEKVRINDEIVNIQDTTQKVSPLMIRMKNSLGEFVKVDLPFLSSEREKRIKDLDKLFVTSGVSLSEKFRKVLEAYLVENEYGTTIGTYVDTIELDGKKQSVEFLKVGRIGLYYLTKDKEKAGIWNLQKNQWDKLSGSHRAMVENAIKVANKQASPSLLTLPIIKSVVVAKEEVKNKVEKADSDSEATNEESEEGL